MLSARRLLRRVVNLDFSKRYRWDLNPQVQASQGGEDGIIEEIFRRLGIERGWFVEFGAWDGVLFSNTYALAQRGWRGVTIEGDPERAADLEQNMKPFPRVIPLCRYVLQHGDDRLDAILGSVPIPRDFDLLSIDIDGNDYWIWGSLADYEPKVVVIEYNPSFGPDESKTIPYDPGHRWDEETVFHGASAAAMSNLGRAKGYTLIAFTRKLNLFFVRNDLVKDRFTPVPLTRVPRRYRTEQRRRDEFIDV